MYKITLINGSIETVIHYPTEQLKVINPRLNKARGQAQQLIFSIYPNNPGYNILTRFATRVIVMDIRDNTEVFSGRVYTVKRTMNKDGLWKDVICEGELNYLHDTVQDSVIYEDKTAKEMLQIFLDYHNSQVEDYKKIYVGNVTVDDWIFCTTNNETTLEAITKYIYDENLGYLQLRKENGIKYLDYIKTTADKVVEVSLGKNLLDMIQTDDQDFGTRIVPVGANGLTIDNVNGGKKYLEDPAAVAKYGIIYKTVQFKDIDNDIELKNQCEAQLSTYTSPKQSLEISALDLATIANVSTDMIDENTSVHLINPLMGIDEIWKVVEYDVDLNEAYNPKLTISNKTLTLTNTLSSIVGSMVRNDGNYNGVQFGDSFGIRIKKDDVVLTLNAKDCISIVNALKKVFYVDENGNIVANNAVLNDVTANRGIYKDITTENMVAKEMRTSNTSNYMIHHDQYIDFYNNGEKVLSMGFIDFLGLFPIPCIINDDSLAISATNSLKLESNSVTVNTEEVATQNWIENKYDYRIDNLEYDVDDLLQRVAILEASNGV